LAGRSYNVINDTFYGARSGSYAKNRGENSACIKVVDRGAQREQILANFRIPEPGTKRIWTAHWQIIPKSREGNTLIDLTMIELPEFPVPYPAFLLSQLVDTCWHHYGNKK